MDESISKGLLEINEWMSFKGCFEIFKNGLYVDTSITPNYQS
jgi:hypothetical protein